MIKKLEKTTEYDGLELTYGDVPVDIGTPRVFTFTALEQWELDTTEVQDGSDLSAKMFSFTRSSCFLRT